jgi:hypothetical protein
MHLAPSEILHVFEAGEKRAEVQRVDELHTPFRVVFQLNGHTLAPSYESDMEVAIDRAKRWAFH